MPATTSTTREERWLRTRGSTVGLRVYIPEPPEDAVYPCVVCRLQSSVDIVNLNGTFMVRSIWLAYISAEIEFQPESNQGISAIETYADSLHAAIYKPQVTLVNGRNIEECRREGEYRDEPVVNGIRYFNLGGTYRILSTLA